MRFAKYTHGKKKKEKRGQSGAYSSRKFLNLMFRPNAISCIFRRTVTVNTKKNVMRGKWHFFRFSPYHNSTIMFLAVILWMNEKIKEILTQRLKYK